MYDVLKYTFYGPRRSKQIWKHVGSKAFIKSMKKVPQKWRSAHAVVPNAGAFKFKYFSIYLFVMVEFMIDFNVMIFDNNHSIMASILHGILNFYCIIRSILLCLPKMENKLERMDFYLIHLQILYQWLSARPRYCQCISNGDSTVMH